MALWTVWSPESLTATKTVAADFGCGGGDSGAPQAARHAALGGEEAAATGEQPASSVWSRERRRIAAAPAPPASSGSRGKKERGKEGFCQRFSHLPLDFSVFTIWSLAGCFL